MEIIIEQIDKKPRTEAQIRASKKFYLLNKERLSVYYKEQYHKNMQNEDAHLKCQEKRKEKYMLIKELLQQHKQNISI